MDYLGNFTKQSHVTYFSYLYLKKERHSQLMFRWKGGSCHNTPLLLMMLPHIKTSSYCAPTYVKTCNIWPRLPTLAQSSKNSFFLHCMKKNDFTFSPVTQIIYRKIINLYQKFSSKIHFWPFCVSCERLDNFLQQLSHEHSFK